MVKVNFNQSNYERKVADAGPLTLKNRYFEKNPFLTDDGSALLARPGMRKLTVVGEGPIRGLGSEAGSFNGDLFVASGGNMYRMDNKLNTTLLQTNLYNPNRGFVSIAVTAQIGDGVSATPAYMFFADGRDLFCYQDNGYAHNTLTGSAAINDVVVIDTIYYKFVAAGSASLSTTASGTSGSPYLIAMDVTSGNALQNLYNAINASGVIGTDYSVGLVEHPTVKAYAYDSTDVSVKAKLAGSPQNSIATTKTSVGLSWALGATLVGGGSAWVQKVQVPNDAGVIDIAIINSYVIVVPVQSNGFQGRFYWIKPGETTIDPNDFATAERSPDGIYGVKVFGDQFWLPGETTTEVWYVTGDATTTMRRLQGIVLDRGSWENTAQAIHETMVIVDSDGGVFAVRGGSPQRISGPDNEEQIRVAMARQRQFLS